MESSFLQHHLRNLAMFHILVFCVLFMNMVIGVIFFWSGIQSTRSSWFLGDVESWWMVWVYSCSIALHALCYQGAITRNKCKIQPFIVLQVIQIAGYIGWIIALSVISKDLNWIEEISPFTVKKFLNDSKDSNFKI